MKTEFSLPEINHLICAADGIEDPATREGRYQKLRVLYQKGLLVPINEVSRGKVAKYTLAGVCEASIALELTRKGMTDGLLRQVFADIRGGETRHRHKLPDGMHNPEIWNSEAVFSSIWTTGGLWRLTIWTFDKPDDTYDVSALLHPWSDGLNQDDIRLRAMEIVPESFTEESRLGKPGLTYTMDLRYHTVALMNEIARQYEKGD